MTNGNLHLPDKRQDDSRASVLSTRQRLDDCQIRANDRLAKPGSELNCRSPEVVSGCNVISDVCSCSSAPACPGQPSPYSFRDLEECTINLDVMHQHARQRDLEGIALSSISKNELYCIRRLY
ncbi:unnamed protein product [Nezara viridula]|uniref:Uncharacterized protein n=1 Tax=Nezara viridula TaxID=85310 RepID=A0A9P0EDE6_NEZVI|nr:unnamed protein product [Nezara viridula]